MMDKSVKKNSSKRSSDKRKKVNIGLEDEVIEQLTLIAAKKNITPTALCREYIYQGLSGQLCENNLDIITKILREQMQAQLKPSVERLAGLVVKTGIMAASTNYLSAEALASFVPDNKKREFDEAYALARKKGIYYMRSKPTEDEVSSQ